MRSGLGVFFGFFLFCAAFPLLWWNEGTAVRDYTSITQLDRIAVAGSPDARDPAHDGKAVVLSGGQTRAEAPLRDPQFDLEIEALRLRRVVEMYQWKENKEGTRIEDGTRVTYEAVWHEGRIDDSAFRMRSGHGNPVPAFDSTVFQATNVRYGEAFTLAPELVRRLSDFAPVDPGQATARTDHPQHLDGLFLYIGQDPLRPEIGDLRVRFEAVLPQQVSLIAGQAGKTLQEHMTRSGNAYAIIRPGVHGQAGLVEFANTQVGARTTAFRIFGFAMMIIGLRLLVRPLTRALGWIPVLGRLVGAGAWIFAGVLGGACALLTISAAWLAHRPLLSLGLIVAAAVLIEVVVLRERRKTRSETSPS